MQFKDSKVLNYFVRNKTLIFTLNIIQKSHYLKVTQSMDHFRYKKLQLLISAHFINCFGSLKCSNYINWVIIIFIFSDPNILFWELGTLKKLQRKIWIKSMVIITGFSVFWDMFDLPFCLFFRHGYKPGKTGNFNNFKFSKSTKAPKLFN